MWRDLLFRLRVYRGLRVASPPGLIRCSLHITNHLTTIYETEINNEHHLADWLFDECEGPWRMGMYPPLARRKSYVAFARAADAVMFRILSA